MPASPRFWAGHLLPCPSMALPPDVLLDPHSGEIHWVGTVRAGWASALEMAPPGTSKRWVGASPHLLPSAWWGSSLASGLPTPEGLRSLSRHVP